MEQRPGGGSAHEAQVPQASDVRPRQLRPAAPSRAPHRLSLRITQSAGEPKTGQLQYAHGKALIADAGYDADHLMQAVRERGMTPVIAMNPTRKHHRRCNSRALYRMRIQVDCMFHRLKRFRAVATRFEKTAINYLAVLHLACMMLWLN
ncbi:transposase [Pyxidicoccus sp. MSG2]|uniref:transposase n=1 Tax=Pyxidicoccus sp. MSG2 TaxID=2996790 RepID=UPI00226DCABD|nr:transposase [Pyxidicoccus sp. MSG2]MCY1021362.1 transposase [Pyxidicoccus sp. MSG2]